MGIAQVAKRIKNAFILERLQSQRVARAAAGLSVLALTAGLLGFNMLAMPAVAHAEETCTPVTAGMASTWTTGCYVVDSDVTIDPRIVVNGTVKLVLNDGKKLTATRGINVSGGNTLIINQPEGGTGSGTLYVPLTSFNRSDPLFNSKWGQAGIGADKGSKNAMATTGTIEIHGGTLDVSGGYFAAGIGGGYFAKDAGTVKITGGTVKATGDNIGAGIGGGRDTVAGNVTITGGTVEANGGNQLGAGIGGGQCYDRKPNCDGGSTTIKGGTVIAKGNNGGAGIGGSSSTSGHTVNISGGKVFAQGAVGGAGIGGGYGGKGSKYPEGSKGGDVTISGGVVVAIGSYWNDPSSSAYNASAIGAGTTINGQEQADPGTFTVIGNALVFVNTQNNAHNPGIIGDTSKKDQWKGVVYEGYSPTSLDDLPIVTDGDQWKFAKNWTTKDGETLTIGESSTLTIPEGATWTNNSLKVTAQNGGQLVVKGDVSEDSKTTDIKNGGEVIPRSLGKSLTVDAVSDTSMYASGGDKGRKYCLAEGSTTSSFATCQKSGDFFALLPDTAYTLYMSHKPDQYYRTKTIKVTTGAAKDIGQTWIGAFTGDQPDTVSSLFAPDVKVLKSSPATPSEPLKDVTQGQGEAQWQTVTVKDKGKDTAFKYTGTFRVGDDIQKALARLIPVRDFLKAKGSANSPKYLLDIPQHIAIKMRFELDRNTSVNGKDLTVEPFVVNFTSDMFDVCKQDEPIETCLVRQGAVEEGGSATDPKPVEPEKLIKDGKLQPNTQEVEVTPRLEGGKIAFELMAHISNAKLQKLNPRYSGDKNTWDGSNNKDLRDKPTFNVGSKDITVTAKVPFKIVGNQVRQDHYDYTGRVVVDSSVALARVKQLMKTYFPVASMDPTPENLAVAFRTYPQLNNIFQGSPAWLRAYHELADGFVKIYRAGYTKKDFSARDPLRIRFLGLDTQALGYDKGTGQMSDLEKFTSMACWANGYGLAASDRKEDAAQELYLCSKDWYRLGADGQASAARHARLEQKVIYGKSAKKATVHDVVGFTGLDPQKTYLLVTKLVDHHGKEIPGVDPVETRISGAAQGQRIISVDIPASALNKKLTKAVFLNYLYEGDSAKASTMVIASDNLDNASETLTIQPEKKIPSVRLAQTGTNGLLAASIALSVLLILAGTMLARSRRRLG